MSHYHDKMNVRKVEDPCAKNAEGASKIYLEVFLSKKFLQTRPQEKNIIINYYGLYDTGIKNSDEKKL